jgi:hypothetical protein
MIIQNGLEQNLLSLHVREFWSNFSEKVTNIDAIMIRKPYRLIGIFSHPVYVFLLAFL